MFQFPNPFDATTVDPSQFPQIPLGDYKVMIVGSEPKQNKEQTGGYLQLDLQILEGQFAGLIVPDRLNLFHQDQKTVEMANRRLSAYSHVTGQLRLQNSGQLHNIPFIATIGPQKENPQYNQIYTVKDMQGNVPGKKQNNAVPAAQAPLAPVNAGWNPAAPQQPQQTGWTPNAGNVGNPVPAAQAPLAVPPWQQAPQQSIPVQQPPQAAPQYGPPQFNTTPAPPAVDRAAQPPWQQPNTTWPPR